MKNILILILLVSAILRLWKVPELFFFNIDEEYQAHLAWAQVKDFHPIWIGVSAANTGFYIGPGVTYLNAALFWLSQGDPLILAYFASLLGCATLAVLFLTVRDLFNNKIAFIASTLYGFSHLVIMYDRRFWNPTFIPLTVILLFYSLVKARKNPLWYLLVAVLLGAAFHIHASLFILFPVVLFVGVKRLRENKYRINYKILAGSIVVFLAIYSPLIVFDFVHNFDNLKAPFRMFNPNEQGYQFSFLGHVQLMAQTLSKSFYIHTTGLLTSFMSISFVLLFIAFFREKKNESVTILGYFLITYILALLFYPGLVLEYYYLGFLPVFFIAFGVVFAKINSFILGTLLVIFAFSNVYTFTQTRPDDNLAVKKALIQETSRFIEDKKFYLDTQEPYLYFGGWKYLFDVYGKSPGQSKADAMFGWIYPQDIVAERPKTTVFITQTEAVPTGTIIKKVTKGVYKSYIVIDDAK